MSAADPFGDLGFSGPGDDPFADLGYAGISTSVNVPARVRAVVGAARGAPSKLATLRRMGYPDAEPEMKDGKWTGNFTFTDPQTGVKGLFNPPGLDMGDIAEWGREGFQTGGSAVGAGLMAGLTKSPRAAAAGGTLGSQIAGSAFDVAMKATTPLEDVRSWEKQIVDAATDTAADYTFGRLGDIGVNRLQQKIHGGPDEIPSVDTSNLTPEAQAFKALGIEAEDVPAGMLNPTAAKAERVLENAFWRSYRPRYEAMQDRVGDVIRTRLASGTREEAGTAIRESADNYIELTAKQGGRMYTDLWDMVPGDARTTMPNLRETLGELSFDDEAIGELVQSPLLKRLMSQELESITVRDLGRLRTAVGKALRSSNNLRNDSDIGELKQLYKAMTGDLELALTTQGDEGALNLWRAANEYWKKTGEVIEGPIKRLVGGRNPASEEIYTRYVNRAKQGPTVSRDILRFMGPDARDQLHRRITQEASFARAGQQDFAGERFSPATYLTDYNALRRNNEVVGEMLPDIAHRGARVADYMKRADIETNVSKTGRAAGGVLTNVAAPLSVAGSAFFGHDVNPITSLGAGGLVWAALHGIGKAGDAALQSPAMRRFLATPQSQNMALVKRVLPGIMAAEGLTKMEIDKVMQWLDEN